MVTNIGKLTTTPVTKSIPTKQLAARKGAADRPVNKSRSKDASAALPAKAIPRIPQQAAGMQAATAESQSSRSRNQRSVTPEERHGMIATAAYFHAEQRGFTQGYELEDWVFGEAEIDSRLSLKKPIAEPRIHFDNWS